MKNEPIKLIFNPQAGAARKIKVGISDVLGALKALEIVPDVYLVEPGKEIQDAVRSALAKRFLHFAVCGGDGTISAVAGALAGTAATLAIFPTGSQNNMALSLGIPSDIAAAAALLRTGRVIKVDVGMATCGTANSHFMEICSVGLVSSLSSSGDAIQHGRYASVGEFLSTLLATAPSDIDLLLDGKKHVQERGHIVLVTNMPFVGFHYQVGHPDSHKDGLLNVHFFADLTKIDLLKYISQGIYPGKPEDPRIQHFLAHTVDITTNPAMPVMIDAHALGQGSVHIEIHKKALRMMVAR